MTTTILIIKTQIRQRLIGFQWLARLVGWLGGREWRFVDLARTEKEKESERLSERRREVNKVTED